MPDAIALAAADVTTEDIAAEDVDLPVIVLRRSTILPRVIDESVGADSEDVDRYGSRRADDEAFSAEPDDIGYTSFSVPQFYTEEIEPAADGSGIADKSYALALSAP